MTAEKRTEMMLNAPVSRVIPRLAIPTIISMLISSIYNMADTFFVSQIGRGSSLNVILEIRAARYAK